MNQSTLQTVPVSNRRSAGARGVARYMADAIFIALSIVVLLKVVFGVAALHRAAWPEATLVCAATAATMISLSRQLPFQNVLLASVVIAVIGGGIGVLNALTSVPSGPCVYLDAAGPRLFGVLPWSIPLMWVVVILNARGVGRLILRPWRKTRNYGFGLMGVTALLSVVLEFGLELFCVRGGRYWVWMPTRLTFDWFPAPLTNLLVWPATVLLILAFATPALIRKKPGSSPPDYQPLFVWLVLNALFAGMAFSQRLWPTAVVVIIASVIAAWQAIRGAKW